MLNHSWECPPAQARLLQDELASRVKLEGDLRGWRTVAAADSSYDRGSNWISAGVVVMRRGTWEVIEQAVVTVEVPFPYIPGLLSFREVPPLLRCFERISAPIDVVLCDGQGRAHPRRFGLACHLGLWLNLPTIGCAKSRLCGEFIEPGPSRGDRAPLVDGSETIGAVVRTRAGTRPLFVSPGHLCTLDAAVAVLLDCQSKYRLPIPARHAHELVNQERRRWSTAKKDQPPRATEPAPIASS